MSLFNSVMSNTVGVLWQAASGTVDPWTKQNLIDDETASLVQASGGASTPGAGSGNTQVDYGAFGTVVDPITAQQQATQDITNTLGASKSDPSFFLQQVGASFGRAFNYYTGKNTNLTDPNQANVDPFSLGMWALAVVAVVATIFFGIRALTK